VTALFFRTKLAQSLISIELFEGKICPLKAVLYAKTGLIDWHK